MMRLADSDILIDLLRSHPPAVAWFASLADKPAVPGFVVMELVQGCSNARELRAVNTLIRPLSLVWPTEVDCGRALADFTRYHLSYRLGLIDSLIAATATGQGATLCTFNVRHYRPVAGLTTEQPYIR